MNDREENSPRINTYKSPAINDEVLSDEGNNNSTTNSPSKRQLENPYLHKNNPTPTNQTSFFEGIKNTFTRKRRDSDESQRSEQI